MVVAGLGKIIIDTNNNPEHFLTINPYYDSLVRREGGWVWGWMRVLKGSSSAIELRCS